MNPSQIYLGGCIAAPELIDLGIAEGIRTDTFTDPSHASIWSAMMEQRSKGLLTDVPSLVVVMGKDCPMQEIFDCERANGSSSTAKKAMKKLVWEHAKRNVRPAINDVLSLIDDDAKPDEVIKAIEGLQHMVKPQEADALSLDQLIADLEVWAKQEIDGTRETGDVVMTGLPYFDNHAGGIESHEYVVVGARTSIGKSSFMAQIAGHNLQRGLRVAYFTLETSAQAVCRQIAGQRSRVNLRSLRQEMPNKQAVFLKELAHLKAQPFRVFDRDLRLPQIESRCRALAASWKPQLVMLDYMGLIQGTEGSAYERMGQLSKAMIPIRKALGCTLIVGAQLNRGNEREDRAPSRTDFRDAGSIEEDAHRILALHRPSKDFNGQQQELGQTVYDYELLQLKLRDGPLAHARIKYNAPHTWFYEEAVR